MENGRDETLSMRPFPISYFPFPLLGESTMSTNSTRQEIFRLTSFARCAG
jgi:hypothetical protein